MPTNILASLKRQDTIQDPSDEPESEAFNFERKHNGDSLFTQYLYENPSIKKKDVHEQVMRAFEANIYLTGQNKQPYFSIPVSFPNLKALGQSQDIVNRVLDWLTYQGYIVREITGSNLTHKVSTYKILKPIPLANITITNEGSKAEVIVKDKDKKIIDYPDTAELKGIKSNLTAINTHLETATLTDHNGNIHSTRLRRIFSNGSLKLHGRFYDGYMNISSTHRLSLNIDGSRVVILDFRSMAVRMLYAKEGFVLNTDPYTLGEYDRDEIKDVFNRMLNTSGISYLINSLKKDYDDLDESMVEAIATEIQKQHQPIAQYLFPQNRDSNLIAMYLESSLVEEILLRTINSGLIMYPVHDAFIVKEEDKDKAISLITNTFNELYPKSIANNIYPLLKIES